MMTHPAVMITAGGTREYLDGVRFLGNVSSGETGVAIAEYLAAHGCKITCLCAADIRKPAPQVRMRCFHSFSDLHHILLEELRHQNFTAVIHAAAVSDFSIDYLTVDGERREPGCSGKLSSAAPPVIHLKSNPKLISQIKSFAGRTEPLVIGFKLTNTPDNSERAHAVQHLFAQGGIDFVVQNDLAEIDRLTGLHYCKIYDKTGLPVAESQTKEELARALLQIIWPQHLGAK
ncbi:MAG TPA: phosphopantothenoylcysteine decarboxylase [Oligoflexia bacterium]|nr:phosphopantothenoylcysteine decarboxylase [Oligoflexia bacterium]